MKNSGLLTKLEGCGLLVVAMGLSLAPYVLAGPVRPIQRAASLPQTTPWDLDVLSQSPEVEWSTGGAGTRALYYAGEPYQGRATRVFAYPPDSVAKTYDRVQGEKNLHFVPDLPHGYFFEKPKAMEVFMGHHLTHGVALAKIAEVVYDDDQVRARVDSKTVLVKALLHYTVDDLNVAPNQRRWLLQPATISQGVITSKRPPADAQIWFLIVMDERETTVSSKLMFST